MKRQCFSTFILGLVSLPAFAVQYTYDSLSRLTSVNYDNGQTIITYTYDAAGNRLTRTVAGTAVDVIPPVLNITSPVNGSVVTSTPVTIAGTATDAGSGASGVASVTVNGLPATGGTASGGNVANWSSRVPLNPGVNTILVAATDGSANANYTSWNEILIYNPPLLSSSGDGLPDVWKTAHGISLTGNSANLDPDVDGYLTGLEYATGTDPKNAASKPEGVDGLSYVQFRDRFDDDQYADRWVLGAIQPFSDYTLTEAENVLNTQLQQPGSDCTGYQLQSYAAMDVANTVYRATFVMEGYGRTSVGLMRNYDQSNKIELIFDNDHSPALQILSVDGGVETLAPAAVSATYQGAPVHIRLIKTGNSYAVYVNHVPQGNVINNGLGDTTLRPFMGLQSCSTDGGAVNTTVDEVQMLLDRDGDGLPDLVDDKNVNGVVDAGETGPLNPDSDDDGVMDGYDNCSLVPNPDQRDSNADGYGNQCDADLNNDGRANSLDLGLFKKVYGTADPDSDLNGDGRVNSLDLGLFKKLYGQPPGPSGILP